VSATLLSTKLHIPPVRPAFVPRPRLTERLSMGMGSKLTLLAAPAGSGKTTALSAWLDPQAEQGELYPFVLRPVQAAWVSLDSEDNDERHFWRYVITSLAMCLDDPGQAALPDLETIAAAPIDRLLASLVNHLSYVIKDTVLVLDDYHMITAPAIHAGLAFLLDHLPPRLHLVIASRTSPPIPLARLRGRGQLTEIRPCDLGFTLPDLEGRSHAPAITSLLLAGPRHHVVILSAYLAWVFPSPRKIEHVRRKIEHIR
jgi:LuxR family transcriptional regulator, maltose regulon positive regulatory protein